MSYYALDAWWWPFVFILIAGWLATDIWRWLGVIVGNRLQEGSLALTWVRAMATSLIAGIIAKLILQPTGSLADFDIYLRVLAVATGFLVFLMAGKRIAVGILVALLVLLVGDWGLNFRILTRLW
ncbi:AzlD domain-containing protein [Lentilitoribacter sp. Alg239-R112]|jgi:branched-subunit amino acid transport protein|uniref:AzlD domain-containing protein n=1 Tax=Lentilitoribacter sp. Alg239-R112 TaxID=2305987 RepID=UPI0013A6C65F|nr:AzlD domain-containing protein [Lentilitoribacter sp. Alg239-R112]